MNKSHLIGALCIGAFAFITNTASAVILPLESRLGGLAYYDPNLNITWSTNTNINGTMDYQTANSWATSVIIGGVGGWRLPNMDVNGGGAVDCSSVSELACRDNEFGYQYAHNGISSTSPGPFIQLVPGEPTYWSSNFVGGGKAYGFNFDTGSNFQLIASTSRMAWAVHDGDVGAAVIPLPASLWLFGSGLLGLIGMARKKEQ